jgi:hypothetical protein
MHRGSTGEEAFLGNLQESRNKTADGATSCTPDKGYLLPVESREFPCLKNPFAHFSHKGVDTDYKEKRSRHSKKRNENPSSYPSGAFALKEGQKGIHHRSNSFLPPTSSSSGGYWSHLPSVTTSQPCQGKNLPNEKLGNGGTDAGIFGDITRLGSGTQRNLYPRMKSRK